MNADNQASFNGWAKVEVMGHQSHVGFVTTEAFGQAVMFRIDSPAIEESVETLERAEWAGEQYCQAGSVVKRAAVQAHSVLVGAGSIYRIIPCDEATALKAIRSEARRPLMAIILAKEPARLTTEDDEDDPYEDEREEMVI